jgi:hypothetical protein
MVLARLGLFESPQIDPVSPSIPHQRFNPNFRLFGMENRLEDDLLHLDAFGKFVSLI